MNATRLYTRIAAFGFAAFITFVTLAGVDVLARQEPSAALMVRSAVSAQA
jgi:hypothetical protein